MRRGGTFLLLFAAVTAARGADAPPSEAEQDRILAAMHEYADQYVSNLPNFLCVQTTRQLEAGIRAKKFKGGDTLVYSLSFNEGEEKRTLQMVNGKRAADVHRWHAPLRSEGEFGILLSQVLGKQSEAIYSWNRWEQIGGKRLAVFDFAVDKEHSTLSLRLSDLANAMLPYRGSLYSDPESGAVWRVSDLVTDIPEVLHTRGLSTTVDYAEVSIGEKKYLLPTEAVVSLLLDSRRIRNEIAFTEYRKFAADSVIQFDAK